MRSLILIFILMISQYSAMAAILPKADILSLYKITDTEAMPKIAEKYEVVRKLADGYEVIVPLKNKKDLLKISPSAKLLEQDINSNSQILSTTGELDYRTWDDVQKEMYALEKKFPEWVKVVPYGQSQQKRPLLALKISDNVQAEENEPEILITAATHGDEVITTEVVMNLLNRITNGALNSNARMTNLIDKYQIYFVPVVNPDGFYSRLRYDNNVDPNRSYPWPKNPDAKPTACIAGLISLFSSHNFVGSLDYHAFGQLIMYPWAYTKDLIPESDYNSFDLLAKNMAIGNNYTYGPISHVIYVAQGSSADYYYWKNKTKAFAIEIGTGKQPSPSKFAYYTEEQAEPLWKFLESF